MEAFSAPSVRGIISTIGGDDSIRILRHLDLDVLRDHPKLFVGYSDSTVTHFACLAAGLTSLYGPTFMSGFGENAGVHPYLADSFRRAAFTADAPGLIEPSAERTVESLPWGAAQLTRAAGRWRRMLIGPTRPLLGDPSDNLPRRAAVSRGWATIRGPRGADPHKPPISRDRRITKRLAEGWAGILLLSRPKGRPTA